ncbi:zinc ABC transporter substrate-binding protein [uncultured Paracoccus sp.]|uniref:zinc ABC transporter substrate-binding protein n=1 Tax=uncultured Paracoccus sp. TaxID=189685 RepID=UPI002625D155|nr:zinc ABC transporter substrate-binding protein [uncultured Paracoccus sp.]
MSRPCLTASLLSLLALLPTAPVAAAVPGVVTDIAPVQGLVARVMQGLGTPTLLVDPGASPHGYALRPSHASALSDAQVVFFVGPELTPWLMKSVETLAPDARRIELLAVGGTTTLPLREGVTFDAHDHGAETPSGDQDGAEQGHDHTGIDPHAWLDPDNGAAWMTAIAAELSRIDPENAQTYGANAADGIAEVQAAAAEVRAQLQPLSDLRYIVFHDAFQYLERHFDLPAAGAITLGDASAPGPGRIVALKDRVAALQVTCALSEPQFDPDLLATVFEGMEVKTAVIDPLGSGIPPGPGFYPALIRSIGTALSACR